ncbi:FKBP-type peptidyl-prolyl cis-trans isomerase [Hymenobacter convexus]|uniref:FKBP-type peptidyl-prolyl cis-trans isomerase n=1 Tax=Hymenobacter sp. CA1UV-4 TaxID=3063782 RepID=UPI002712C957|nr:FKBP-type peptidyl-prolyl cis-trans isomerase [Hymenobacter sp. CA1UV-4]MDO7853702.1 FKBP-type peptidyl-prolyl cis-trans isomerase [Hymenobacter sp. CA1UV-4]
MTNLLLRARYWVLAAGMLLAAPALWSCNSQTTYQKQLAEHDTQLRAIDEDTIQHYLKRNNLLSGATRTSSGLYLVPITNGTGAQVTKGAQIQLKYVGRFLSNGAHPESSGYPASYGDPRFPQGTVFDNSADNKTQCGCVVFTGGSGAIPGFNEGLLLMRKGDRKLLLIPSRLAYGPAGSQDPRTGAVIIPPDSALMFDVEILDVF